MAARTVKGHKVLLMIVMVSVCMFVLWGGVHAKLPEPDNIIYGIAGDGVGAVRLEVGGQQIASYTMGENPDAGGFYILRVPLDSLDPPEPGAARVGDAAEIFVDDAVTSSATVTIGERGSIQKVHLTDEDIDSDGLHDGEEAYLGTNPWNSDTDGDGVTDVDEVEGYRTQPLLGDTDQDGYSDGHEIGAGTSPLDEDEQPVIYVDDSNTPGPGSGTAADPYTTIGDGILNSPEQYVVQVAAGLYQESVTIDRNIKLLGESSTTTIIDADAAENAIDCDYTTGVDELVSIERFTIKNADTGVLCRTGTSPLIRNNVITEMAVFGISCEDPSSAQIVNNTVVENVSATAIKSYSAGVSIINNIISDNDVGIDGEVAGMVIDYNNLWGNLTDDYVGFAVPGTHDFSTYPSFVGDDDFHLRTNSLCIDAGDPVELLAADYTAGSLLNVDEITLLGAGDRVWIFDGLNRETDIVDSATADSCNISGEFMNSYAVADGAFIFTATSDASLEPVSNIFRVDMGAYGNTDEAGPTALPCDWDLEGSGDGDVDGQDLAAFAAAFNPDDLDDVAGEFGRSDCE